MVEDVLKNIVPPKLIDKLWPHIWPLIKEIVVLETEEELLADIRAGNRFVIVVGDGVCIIRNCGKFMEINYVGGKNAKKWWPIMSAFVESMAKAFGHNSIVAFGRDAWKKLAPDFEPTRQRMYIKRVA